MGEWGKMNFRERRWKDEVEQVMVLTVVDVDRNHHSLRDPKAYAVSLRLLCSVAMRVV